MFRFCKDIGMWAIDRSQKTCVHRTDFCNKYCYNKKLYRLYKDMVTRDDKNDEFWKSLDAISFKEWNKRRKIKKFRFCTRGEAFASIEDIVKIHNIIAGNPKVTFWVPTRAWRNPSFKLIIETIIKPMKNARVLASTDPTTTQDDFEALKESQWSTMFFGDNSPRDAFKCLKTWGKEFTCNQCKDGCFSKKRVDIHLKTH
jgi:hypothetical protein